MRRRKEIIQKQCGAHLKSTDEFTPQCCYIFDSH